MPERGWLGSVLPLGLVPGTAPSSCLAEMIWSVIGQVAGLGQAGIVDREGEPASGASAAWTISAASAGRMVTPSRPKPQGRGPPALHSPGLRPVAPGGGHAARGGKECYDPSPPGPPKVELVEVPTSQSSDGSDLRRADECEAGSAVYDKGLALC